MNYSLCEDFLNSNKILYPFFQRLAEYQRGKTDFMPWSVEIQPTAKCNHRCVHCSYKERNIGRAQLGTPEMERLVDSVLAMGVKGVYFSGGGEPCCYPHLKDYIIRLTDGGVQVALLTNGTLLEQAGIYEIADRLNYIAVSIPSCDKAMFEKITGVDKVDTVTAVAERIKAIHGQNAPVIGARIIVTEFIAHEIENIFHTLKNNGYDYVLFKIVRDYEDRGLGIDDQTVEEIKKTIDKMREEGLINNAFTNLGDVFAYREPVAFTGKCYVNELGMIANITPEGSVFPNITEIVDPAFCVGNIYDDPLEKLWNNAMHLEIKSRSNKRWLSKECRNCRAITYNKIIEQTLKQLPCGEDCFI